MADELVGTKCGASSLLNYCNLNATQTCEKCAELEIQLQIVHDELSSVQLIIQMLNKERVHQNYITTHIQHVDAERTGDENWKRIKTKYTKRRSEGNMQVKDNELLNTKEIVPTANRFTTLVTNNNTTRNEDETKSTCENTPRTTDNGRKRDVKYPELICSTTVDLQKGLNVNTNAKLNLKTLSATQQQSYTKKEDWYPIPTLINGQTSSKDSSTIIKQTSPQQKKTETKNYKDVSIFIK
jgi:hypothetical protein